MSTPTSSDDERQKTSKERDDLGIALAWLKAVTDGDVLGAKVLSDDDPRQLLCDVTALFTAELGGDAGTREYVARKREAEQMIVAGLIYDRLLKR